MSHDEPIEIDHQLLADVDAYAQARNLSRPAAIRDLIAEGLRSEEELDEIRADLATRDIYRGCRHENSTGED